MVKVCTRPFTDAEFHLNGEVFVCCPSWLRKSIGNLQTDSMEDIWKSESAKEIRDSILDGSYRFCDKNLCPFIQSNTLTDLEKVPENTFKVKPLPHNIMLNYDQSCNLSCPSCRTEKIVHTPDKPAYKAIDQLTDNIYDVFIKNLGEGHLKLNITGSGDPFASGVYKKLLEQIDGDKLPNLKIDLQTNGLLFTPHMWNKLSKIWKNIDRVYVSIDAATEETYVKVRRGGNWQTILDNMKFIWSLRKDKKFNWLQVNLVVQKTNYKEVPAFAKLFIPLCDKINFSLLTDWSTWPPHVYHDQLVWNENHPEYGTFLKVLSDDILLHKKVFIGNLSELQVKARETEWKNKSFLSKLMTCYRLISYELVRRRFFLPGPVQKIIKKIISKV